MFKAQQCDHHIHSDIYRVCMDFPFFFQNLHGRRWEKWKNCARMLDFSQTENVNESIC